MPTPAAAGRPEVRPQPAKEEAHELRLSASPPVFDVEVHDRAVHVGKSDADDGAVLVLPLVHHEDTVGPEHQVPAEGHRGEGGDARRLDLVPIVPPVEILRRRAAIDVRRADEEDALGQVGSGGHGWSF
jgi:hypothetical protein